MPNTQMAPCSFHKTCSVHFGAGWNIRADNGLLPLIAFKRLHVHSHHRARVQAVRHNSCQTKGNDSSCKHMPKCFVSSQNQFSVYSSTFSNHHHHQSLDREGRWGTTDYFPTSFLHFSLFSTALLDLSNSRPVHFLMLSSHLFRCLPCLPPFTVPCKMVLARPDEQET